MILNFFYMHLYISHSHFSFRKKKQLKNNALFVSYRFYVTQCHKCALLMCERIYFKHQESKIYNHGFKKKLARWQRYWYQANTEIQRSRTNMSFSVITEAWGIITNHANSTHTGCTIINIVLNCSVRCLTEQVGI